MNRPDVSPRRALVWAALLLLGTAFTRLFDLAHTPPGEAFDVMWDLAEALRISKGIPFPLLVGESPETLNRFLLVGWFSLLGPSIFTARLFQAFVSLTTVALTYHAGLRLFAGKPWARLGALAAAGAMAAITPHVFLSHTPYRAMLTASAVTLSLILLLRARGTDRPSAWLLAGFVTAASVFTYLAGIAALPWLGGFAVHQALVQRAPRPRWRNLAALLAGAAVPLALWLVVITVVPDYFLRVGEASPETSLPLAERLATGLRDALRAFFSTGYFRLLYNTPDSPFFNPALALFVIAGVVPALRRWRHADGALLLGGIVTFTLPGALSENATMPLRLIGTWSLLSLLGGWGVIWLVGGAVRLVERRARSARALRLASEVAQIGVAALLAASLASTHRTYHAMFADEDLYDPPEYWLGIPHNYAMAIHETLELMIELDRPSYVPLALLDTPMAAFMLQRDAYPHVTTWARYGLDELPAGQIFYPLREYFHDPTLDAYPLQALLLPDEDTIVILPGDEGRPVIRKPSGNGVTVITNARGWELVAVQDVPARPLPARQPAPDTAPEFGEGLRLVNRAQPFEMRPGAAMNVILEWEVSAPQKADVFSFAQIIDSQYNAVASSDHHVWQYLYPSARWRPGDVVPDLHTLRLPEQPGAGLYRIGSGAYVPPRIDRLPINASAANTLADLGIWRWGAGRRDPPPDVRLPEDATPLGAALGEDIVLEGYTLDRDGDVWTVDLYWHTTALPQDDLLIFIHATVGDAIPVQWDGPPNDGQTPTWSWWPGYGVRTTHTLRLSEPPDALYAGLYSYPSLARLPAMIDGQRAPDDRILLWTKAQLPAYDHVG